MNKEYLERTQQKIRVKEQLNPFTESDEEFGRLNADLHDLVECSEWLLAALETAGDKKMTDEEIETFLIDLDTRFAEHVMYHASSLHEGISKCWAN